MTEMPEVISWKNAIKVLRFAVIVNDERSSSWDGRPCHVVDLADGRSIAFVSDYEHSPGYSSWTPSDFSVYIPKCLMFSRQGAILHLDRKL